MIIFSARQPLTLKYFGEQYALQPLTWPEINLDHLLAAPDGLGISIINRHKKHLQVIKFDHSKLPGFPRRLKTTPGNLPEGSRIIMLRDAGIGDAITMLPVIDYLQDLPNNLSVCLATLRDRHPLFSETGLAPLPIRLSELVGKADYFVEFHDPGRIIEKVEIIDFNFSSLNIDPQVIPAKAKIPRLNKQLTSDTSIRQEINELSRNYKIRIMIAPGASDILRQLPIQLLSELAQKYQEIAFICPGQSSSDQTNIFSIDTSKSLNAFITAIDHCDALISADSSAYHIAAALNKPALTIFGPIPSTIRSGYYPQNISIDADYNGETCHSPCFIHGHVSRNAGIPIGREQLRILTPGAEITTFSGHKFNYDPNQGCPEMNFFKSSNAPCIQNIPTARIIDGVEKILSTIER